MSRTSRRKFAKTIAAASVAIPVISLAQTASPAPPPTTAKAAEDGKREPKNASALGLALTAVVSAQSGHFLTESEMQRVHDDFQDYVPFVERLRNFKLTNADEPDFTFHPLVDRW